MVRPSFPKDDCLCLIATMDSARLTCMKSETGDELWRFEYPTNYEDLYGYNNGPRTCPVVDGNRVYIFGPEGMLHCVTVLDGKLLWRVDTTLQNFTLSRTFLVSDLPLWLKVNC